MEVNILNEGRQGIFGLGAEEAKIRVEPLVPLENQEDIMVEEARGVLENLLAMMDVVASVDFQAAPFTKGEEETTAPIVFDIKGEDLGILIGRHGQTLSCLQYIVRLIVAHQTNAWVPITIDVEGYKQRRCEVLQALAWRMAEQVKAKGTPVTLKPMSAYERRIIHITLADQPDVTTQSIGEDEERKVVIQPKG